MSVHPLAKSGFQQGEFYEAHRPTYTDESVGLLVDVFVKLDTQNKNIKYDILELGCGTGKFTRKFLQLLPKGSFYLATDQSENFLHTFHQLCPEVETKQCTAAAIPLPDDSVKFVVCAQSFHWFANSESLDEIKRVLVPGGKLTLIWNLRNLDVPWMKEVHQFRHSLEKDYPDAATFFWRDVLENHSGFKDFMYHNLPGVKFQGSIEEILEHLSSSSIVSSMEPPEKEKVRVRYRDLIKQHLGNPEVIELPFTSIIVECIVNK